MIEIGVCVVVVVEDVVFGVILNVVVVCWVVYDIGLIVIDDNWCGWKGGFNCCFDDGDVVLVIEFGV